MKVRKNPCKSVANKIGVIRIDIDSIEIEVLIGYN
jgi:hypothetical protein